MSNHISVNNIHISIDSDDESQSDSEHDEVEEYWLSCNKDCRTIGIVINSVNFLFQLVGIAKPIEGSNQRKINSIYMIWTIFIYVVLGLSFRKDYGVKYSYVTNILLILRQGILILDFEDTKRHMKEISWNVQVLC